MPFTAQVLPGTEDAAIAPIWSPDSRYILFQADSRLKKIDLNGGPAQTICDAGTRAVRSAAWNRDGIILFAGRFGSDNVIARVPDLWILIVRRVSQHSRCSRGIGRQTDSSSSSAGRRRG